MMLKSVPGCVEDGARKIAAGIATHYCGQRWMKRYSLDKPSGEIWFVA